MQNLDPQHLFLEFQLSLYQYYDTVTVPYRYVILVPRYGTVGTLVPVLSFLDSITPTVGTGFLIRTYRRRLTVGIRTYLTIIGTQHLREI